MARGAKQTDAARLAGVSERTVSNRMRDQRFVRKLDAARASLLRQAKAKRAASLVDFR